MQKIYVKDENGKRVTVEVSDDVAAEYRRCLREEWRGNANEKYHTKSLEVIIKAGSDFRDDDSDVEETLIKAERELIKDSRLKNLHKALDSLLPEQRELITKIYFEGLSQEEIAEREGVSKQAISNRVQRIYQRLKKFFEEN